MAAVILFNDYCQDAAQYSLRTISDASTQGSADAARPASNLFDTNIAKTWRRTGLTAGQVAKLQFKVTPIGVYGVQPGFIALPNVRCVVESTGALANALLSIKIDSTAFGGTAIFQGDNYEVPGYRNFGSACPVFQFCNLPGDTDDVYYGGLVPTTSTFWVEITIGPNGAPSSCYVEIGRLMFMNGLIAEIDPSSLEFGLDDPSIVQYSESGVPYVRRKTPRRTMAASFNQLQNWQVVSQFVSAISKNPPANIMALNRFAGQSVPVVAMPKEHVRSSGTNYSISKTAEYVHGTIYGLMSAPLTARLSSLVSNGTDALWDGQFKVTEIPP